MLTVKNASGFDQTELADQSVMYHAKKNRASSCIRSFDAACHPSAYTDSFHPFAYVILNKKTHEFLLIRDHLGIQPLYYYYQKATHTLIFGETIPDILSMLSVTPALSESEVRRWFTPGRPYTDETLYENIYRVEPGHIMQGKPNGQLTKKYFWQLAREGETLNYQDKSEYLAHFSELMDEAIRNATTGCQHADKIAAEFSVGMDSSAVYLASVANGLNPDLFMHAATPGSASAASYNTACEESFLKHYQPNIHRVYAEGFEPMKVFEEYAAWFAGPSPYIFEVFAHNLHREVSNKGHHILLSGFGGDQGVSGHAPLRFVLPELFKHKAFKAAWHEVSRQSKRYRSIRWIQYMHPMFHQLIQGAEDLKLDISNLFKSDAHQKIKKAYPEQRGYFKTLREAEWHFLQGPFSHEIRMRIEYSSIVSQKMGFEYRYPLLYPKLLDFFLSLPISEKRHDGRGRYLMRRYLARYVPVFEGYKKREGLSILPATMDAFKEDFLAGRFQHELSELPYQKLIKDKMAHRMMIKCIQAFMLRSVSAL